MSKSSRIGQHVLASLAALLFTFTAVGAAVGPAEVAVRAAPRTLV